MVCKRPKKKAFELGNYFDQENGQDLTDYLSDIGINVVYMHSDVDTLERIEIIQDLRLGKYDCLVGVNLLREGLDIPECALVAILDADKEGFCVMKLLWCKPLVAPLEIVKGG